MSDENVTVTVVGYYASRPEKVFDAWLNPEMIGQFMFGPLLREEEIIHIQVDPVIGGKFSFLVQRDGQKLDHVGEYLDIKRPLRLAFTWGVQMKPTENHSDSRVRIEIIGLGTGTQLTLNHDIPAEWADYADRTKEGWTKILNVLADIIDG
ncbi:MAG: SRPBCC family protein [Bdellovibrionota bacterium]